MTCRRLKKLVIKSQREDSKIWSTLSTALSVIRTHIVLVVDGIVTYNNLLEKRVF